MEVEGSEAERGHRAVAYRTGKALIPVSLIWLTERLRCLRAPNDPLRIRNLAGNVTGVFTYTCPWKFTGYCHILKRILAALFWFASGTICATCKSYLSRSMGAFLTGASSPRYHTKTAGVRSCWLMCVQYISSIASQHLGAKTRLHTRSHSCFCTGASSPS